MSSQVLIINDKNFMRDIVTSYDILITKPTHFYGRIDTTGDICVSHSAVFHGPVNCRRISVFEAHGPLHFKKTVTCDEITTNGGITAESDLCVENKIEYDGWHLTCKGTVTIGNDRIVSVPMGQKTLEKTIPVTSLTARAETPIALQNTEIVCRKPFEWELQFFSEEEHDFYAKHEFVDFPVKYPEKPFIHVYHESAEGELTFKELVLIDPENKYLTSEDEEFYHKKLAYNGGPLACVLQGVSTALGASALLAILPAVGPAAAVASIAAFAVSMPLSWKLNKKISNLVTDKVLLPHEIQLRKNLIEGRRKDEEIQQRSDIYIL